MGGHSLAAGYGTVARALTLAVLTGSVAYAEDSPQGAAPAKASPSPSVELVVSPPHAATLPPEDASPPSAPPQAETGAGAPPVTGVETGPPPTPDANAPAADSDASTDAPAIVEEPTPVDPAVAAIRAKLEGSDLRKTAAAEDFAALQAFYGELAGPPLWLTDTGLSSKAQAAIAEIKEAATWGLPADAFDLPSPAGQTADALDEIKLNLAILKYARFARGGRVTPSRVSELFDQRPSLRAPKAVLTEIAAAPAPDAYLRSLHPQHVQFKRLREALAKARAASEAAGRTPENERDVQLILVNMERWRWLPPELGTLHVWNNVPEFNTRVVKGGKTIHTEKTIVGQLKYATPFFSAPMRSIVFHPEWAVPETILREDIQPGLQQRSFFGTPNLSVLRQHNLRVTMRGKPVDPNTVDWPNVNIKSYTFIQSAGPHNVLGKFKFNFPNKHAVYMHDTTQPELFAKTVRDFSHGCIRVHQPERLAALLLAEDKGWSAEQVRAQLGQGTNMVNLSRSIPVHLTYFTATADEQGNVQSFVDLYGLDGRTGMALFGQASQFKAPAMAPAPSSGATAQTRRPNSESRRSATGSAGSIPGLFGN